MVAIVAILMPVLIVLIVYYYSNKSKQEKYQALIEISKNTDITPEQLKEVFKASNLESGPSVPMQDIKNGAITLAVGVGLILFGYIKDDAFMALAGAGALVAVIGLALMLYGKFASKKQQELSKKKS